MQNLFYKFRRNLFNIFFGKNLLWHFLAIILTYGIAVSDFDWKYYVFFNDSAIQRFLFSAAILGGVLPILLPIIFYWVGKSKKSLMLQNIAYATFQAGFLGWLISSFYKAFTGRLQPPLQVGSLSRLTSSLGESIPGGLHPAIPSVNLVDISRYFEFGFLRHGIFWGWPSSHTTIAFSIAVALFVLFPKNWTVRIIALLSAFYIGIGVSMSIHWFSDFVAGAIIGSVVGYVVGKAFLNRFEYLEVE